MAKKPRKPSKGPPPKAQEWLEERRRRQSQGQTPGPQHELSVWDTSLISDDCTPATPEMIAEAEARLGVSIPESMKKQMLIQNGGCLIETAQGTFGDSCLHWTNATIDGIEPVQSWVRARDDHWFDSVKDLPDLHLLIRIAAHSEAQFCLDYRKSGGTGIPAVTYLDVDTAPTRITVIAATVDEFIRVLVASRKK